MMKFKCPNCNKEIGCILMDEEWTKINEEQFKISLEFKIKQIANELLHEILYKKDNQGTEK